jgi:hypothetical protein
LLVVPSFERERGLFHIATSCIAWFVDGKNLEKPGDIERMGTTPTIMFQNGRRHYTMANFGTV